VGDEYNFCWQWGNDNAPSQLQRNTMSRTVALVLAVAAAAGTASAQSETRAVDGTLSYLQRIALPPNAEVVVEARGLRDVLLAETRFVTEGAQVPLPFALEMPAGPGARVTAAIALDGQTRWLGETVLLAPGNENATLGNIVLTSYPTGAIPTPMLCGDTAIMMSFDGEATIIDVNGQTLRLMPVTAASGARFEMPGDGTTYFWSKGETAMLSVLGTEYPECVAVAAPAPEPYRAGGNEPGWGLTVTGDAFEWSRMGADPVTGTVPAAVWRDGAVVWDLPDAGLTIRMTDQLCRDTMSGMPFPETVNVETADGMLSGCGGAPVSLLTGGEWLVEDVAGGGVIDNAEVTIEFLADGSVFGSGGCNRYSGGFTLTGEGLGFGPAATTMMACPEAASNMEQSFFQTLSTVIRFDISDTGALMLYDAEGAQVIRAFRR
jgi:heat shock protein HslJ/uncharacterized lipoprotein YbaY